LGILFSFFHSLYMPKPTLYSQNLYNMYLISEIIFWKAVYPYFPHHYFPTQSF
jgi:hypothetical protein